MKNKLYPITFAPIYKEKLWGGDRLAHILARELPSDQVGESWEVAAHSNGMSQVDQGPLKGRTLTELVQEYGADLVGTRGMRADDKFPLLMKFIDAKQDLSVQVHPDDLYACQHEDGELGKTEMWYIVHSDPGAWIVWGLKPGVSKDEFAQAITVGGTRLIECLNKVKVKPGEVYPISAGLIHALGAGVVVAEIQQNSDTTYRVYDWDRVDEDGVPRNLHIEHALAVTDFSEAGYSKEIQGERCNQYFAFDVLQKPLTKLMELNESFHILTSLQTEATLVWDAGTITLRNGQSCLVPAMLGKYNLTSAGVVLCSHLP